MIKISDIEIFDICIYRYRSFCRYRSYKLRYRYIPISKFRLRYRSFDFYIGIYRYQRLQYRKVCSSIRSWISGRCRLPTSVACCSLCTSVCNSSHSTADQGSFHVGCAWAYASLAPCRASLGLLPRRRRRRRRTVVVVFIQAEADTRRACSTTWVHTHQ